MGYMCKDLAEVKIVVRSILVSCSDALTVSELWKRTINVFGGHSCIQLNVFGYETPFDFLKSIPDVVQLEDPDNTNSILNLVSSKLSRHMELLVLTNVRRPREKKVSHAELFIPYRVQCAFIRLFYELYPKGMTISDFQSNVLCFPIFESFNNRIDVLLYNLDHIFIRKNEEIIALQPVIQRTLNSLIEASDKYSSVDIINLDSSTLEDKNCDQQISNGLEYPLFNILEEPIKNNIEQLLDTIPGWIFDRDICNLYIEHFGSAFNHHRRWGFSRVSQMFSKLPELCCCHFTTNEIKILSSKNHTCDIYTKPNVLKDANESENLAIEAKDKTNTCDDNTVLKQFLTNDRFLEASLNECFLGHTIQCLELKINSSLDVTVCEVNTDFLPVLICQLFDQQHEFKKLLFDMKTFYFINESKFIFDPIITMMKHTYAYFLDGFWFRGIVINIGLSLIKMINIDSGSMDSIPLEDIRLLHVKFAQLPPQSLTFKLHGIDFIDENELLKIKNKKCTVYVVSIDKQNKVASVKIKLTDSLSDNYLNDEWIESGLAEQYSDEN